MGRIMAFDYGKKRIGVAVTDPLQLIANGLDTVSPQQIYTFLNTYLSKEVVDLFVVGYPKTMQNSDSDSMKQIVPFVKSLENKYPNIPIKMVDERFTSVLAHQTIHEAGIKKKVRQEDKQLVDKISATIILQSFLESNRYKL